MNQSDVTWFDTKPTKERQRSNVKESNLDENLKKKQFKRNERWVSDVTWSKICGVWLSRCHESDRKAKNKDLIQNKTKTGKNRIFICREGQRIFPYMLCINT